jgi:small subunit ribosomal protein S21
MLIVKLDKNTGIEKALKLLKSKVIKTRQSSQLVERKEYEKKSVRKRKMMKKAKYVQKMRSNEN